MTISNRSSNPMSKLNDLVDACASLLADRKRSTRRTRQRIAAHTKR